MRIEHYSFGRIRIDGESYTSDVIIYPDRVGKWWRKRGHQVAREDVQEIVEAGAKVLVIGTGSAGCVDVLEETKKHFDSQGIELIVQKTDQACDTYNEMAGEGVIAALHLTC